MSKNLMITINVKMWSSSFRAEDEMVYGQTG